jgi:hypothetical protein
MSKTQALTPSRDAILKIARELKKKDKESYLDAEDKSYADLAQMPGWKNLKNFITKRKSILKPNLDLNSKNDSDFFKAYGMRSVIYDLVAGELDAVINRVEKSHEEVVKQRNTRAEKRKGSKKA